MRKILLLAMLFWFAGPLAAQQPTQQMDFWRVREGSKVTLVLGTGGECKGTVVTRVEGSLSIKLSEASPACGERDKVVTIRASNTRTVERDTRSGHHRAAKVVAAAG